MDDRATMTMPVDGWRAREEVMQIRGKTFFLASRFLPRTRRLGVFATYAFCRVADDIVDAAPLSGLDAAAGALDRWEQEILSPVDPIARTFAAARDQFAIPLQPAHDLIAGIRIDLAPPPVRNLGRASAVLLSRRGNSGTYGRSGAWLP